MSKNNFSKKMPYKKSYTTMKLTYFYENLKQYDTKTNQWVLTSNQLLILCYAFLASAGYIDHFQNNFLPQRPHTD